MSMNTICRWDHRHDICPGWYYDIPGNRCECACECHRAAAEGEDQ